MSDHTLSIALIVGSVRTERFGGVLLAWLERRLAGVPWLDLDVIDLAEVDLHPRVVRGPSPIAGRLAAADGFVVLTPEYNHSFPAALKHAIDTHDEQWQFKPVSFVSYGASSGGIRAVEQLRLVFAELHATTTRNGVALVAPWEHLGEGGFAPPAGCEAALRATLDELRWWALALRDARRVRTVPV